MIIAEIIRVIHWSLVVFILGTPFFGTESLATLHLLIVPFIMLHWITNQTVCALTELEKWIRGKENDGETFFGQVVGPVYSFKTKGEENLFVWTLLVTLWLITLFRLHATGFAHLRSEFAAAYSSS
jgi:hypothetical protein